MTVEMLKHFLSIQVSLLYVVCSCVICVVDHGTVDTEYMARSSYYKKRYMSWCKI